MANSFKIGGLDVLALSDGTITFPPHIYFQGTTPEQWQPHKRWLDHQGNIAFQLACFLVRSGGKNVLIDTGLGALQMYVFHGGALLDDLASAGLKPEDIDTVFITHLHIDHCGTCTSNGKGGFRPVFPNATYRWTQMEHDHWLTAPMPPGSVFPLSDMQKALGERFEAADDGAALAEGVNVIATPGHTPGHASVVLSSGGERAFVLGDAIACPAQLEETEWSGMGDMDPKLARRSQEAVAREAESSGALVAACHFPELTFGRVLRGEGRRYWQPL
jgi:glyoxylase-like metal-dependent hydrolase (beta-lactamase superfamily II)